MSETKPFRPYWGRPYGNWKDRPKGPNGRPLCRFCGEEIPPGRRRTFCSAECVFEHGVRTDDKVMRKAVLERDKGVCSMCHTDTTKLEGDPRFMDGRGSVWNVDHVIPQHDGGAKLGLKNLRTLCIRCHRIETTRYKKVRAKRKKARPS